MYKGNDGLEHGLILALTETSESTQLVWQNTPILVNADRTWDGVYNTNLMTDSPAASYISTLGTGWYLPSIDELRKLSHNLFEINKALFTSGNTLLSKTLNYWSSTEENILFSYRFNFGVGFAPTLNKTNPCLVRAIRAF